MSYIQNKHLLAEIWKSKLSYCDIIDPDHLVYDVIVDGTFDPKQPRITDKPVVKKLKDVTEPGLTVRLDTHQHMPVASAAGAGKGKLGHLKGSISFEPFILYRTSLDADGSLAFTEIARSHHKDGVFNPNGGRVTHKLGAMILLMVDKFGHKQNWRNYSYIDDLKLEAVLNLSQHVLKFNEARTKNAHAYISRCVETTFIRELRRQKKQGQIRDAVLINAGMTPSHGAMVDYHSALKTGPGGSNF